jgi:hypothetical protein
MHAMYTILNYSAFGHLFLLFSCSRYFFFHWPDFSQSATNSNSRKYNCVCVCVRSLKPKDQLDYVCFTIHTNNNFHGTGNKILSYLKILKLMFMIHIGYLETKYIWTYEYMHNISLLIYDGYMMGKILGPQLLTKFNNLVSCCVQLKP